MNGKEDAIGLTLILSTKKIKKGCVPLRRAWPSSMFKYWWGFNLLNVKSLYVLKTICKKPCKNQTLLKTYICKSAGVFTDQ